MRATRDVRGQQQRHDAIERIRLAVEQLTQPMRIVERYYVDSKDHPYLAEHDAAATVRTKKRGGKGKTARTHVQELPDMLTQLLAATEPAVEAGTASSGGSFESKPSLDLDPIDVYATITREARELAQEADPDRHFAADATLLREKLAAADHHLRRHVTTQRALRRRRANLQQVLDRACLVPSERDEHARHSLEHVLPELITSADSYVRGWRVELDGLQRDVVIAEGPRAPLLALNGAAPQMPNPLLFRTERAMTRWLDMARIAARFDPEPVTVSEPCPICGRANSVVVRGDRDTSTARCSNAACKASFRHEEMGMFRRLIEQRHTLADVADDDGPVDDEHSSTSGEALTLIRAGLEACGMSKAELARQVGVTRTQVSRVLSETGSWSPSYSLLQRMAAAINTALEGAAT